MIALRLFIGMSRYDQIRVSLYFISTLWHLCLKATGIYSFVKGGFRYNISPLVTPAARIVLSCRSLSLIAIAVSITIPDTWGLKPISPIFIYFAHIETYRNKRNLVGGTILFYNRHAITMWTVKGGLSLNNNFRKVIR